MDFTAGYRRVEGTDQAHVLGATVQGVLVMLVECVERAVGDLVSFTSGFVQNFAVTGDAVDRFQVVFVPEVACGDWSSRGRVLRARYR